MIHSRVRLHTVSFVVVVAIATTLPIPSSAQTGNDNPRTILDGVYTEQQALRGQSAYEATCAGCHNFNLQGGRNSALRGPMFMEKWREYNLQLLYRFISNSMPPRQNENAVVLPDDQYLDILTYIVSGNGGPPGAAELTAGDLSAVLFVGAEGPQPLPLGALAMIVGCLERSPSNDWVLTRTSRPVRSQELPFDATTEELLSADALPLGNATFGLRDMAFVRNFDPEEHQGHKVQAKGLMIPGPDRNVLSLTAMQTISAECRE